MSLGRREAWANYFLPGLRKFTAPHRAAGGECQLEIFEGCEHLWIDTPGPQTDRAHEMVNAFIARNLAALRRASGALIF